MGKVATYVCNGVTIFKAMSRFSSLLGLSVVFVLLFNACGKDKINPGNHTSNDTMRFAVSGFDNATMQQNDTLELPISIEYISGDKRNVSLTISVIPEGMALKFEPQIDTPTYTSTISFIAHGVQTGTYNVTLTASSAEVVKTYNMTLQVDTSLPNPVLALAGNYLEGGPCSSSGQKSNNARVSIDNNNINKILIENFWTGSGAMDAVATVDPSTQSLVIDPQQVGLLTVSGTGTYTTNTIQLYYVVTDGNIVHDTCSTVLTKQP